jgi:hypothetical protein
MIHQMEKYITGIAICLVVCFLLNIEGENVLVPTYFARKYKNGSYVDATIKSNWLKISSKSSSLLLQNSDHSHAILNVAPPIVQNGQFVNVTWHGIQNASAEDFIALYCPNNSEDNDYFDFFNVDESSTYIQGYGKYSVQLFNVRTNCEMRYFRQNISQNWQEFVAKSNIVIFEGGPEMPLQIHLALTGNPTEMRVMWVSGNGKSYLILNVLGLSLLFSEISFYCSKICGSILGLAFHLKFSNISHAHQNCIFRAR